MSCPQKYILGTFQNMCMLYILYMYLYMLCYFTFGLNSLGNLYDIGAKLVHENMQRTNMRLI